MSAQFCAGMLSDIPSRSRRTYILLKSVSFSIHPSLSLPVVFVSSLFLSLVSRPLTLFAVSPIFVVSPLRRIRRLRLLRPHLQGMCTSGARVTSFSIDGISRQKSRRRPPDGHQQRWYEAGPAPSSNPPFLLGIASDTRHQSRLARLRSSEPELSALCDDAHRRRSSTPSS